MYDYDGIGERFLSVDPLAQQYAYYTPYQFAGNMPIEASDLDGLEPEMKTGQPARDNNTAQDNLAGYDIPEPNIPKMNNTQGGYYEMDPNKKGKQFGTLPKGDNPEYIEVPGDGIKYYGSWFRSKGNWSPAKGYFYSKFRLGEVRQKINNDWEGTPVPGFSIISFYSKEGDSASFLTFDSSEGKVVNFSNVAAFIQNSASFF